MKTLRPLVPLLALLFGGAVLAADGGTARHAAVPAPKHLAALHAVASKAVASQPKAQRPAKTEASKHKARTAMAVTAPGAKAANPVHVAKETHPARHETDTMVPLSGERDEVLDRARAFFDALLQGEPERALESAGLPFWLESRKIDDHDALLRAWNQALGDERVDLLTLYSIELLTPKEMLTRYGKPPKRLAGFPWQGRDRYIAIANLSGHAAIAVLGKLPNGAWRVIGYTD